MSSRYRPLSPELLEKAFNWSWPRKDTDPLASAHVHACFALNPLCDNGRIVLMDRVAAIASAPADADILISATDKLTEHAYRYRDGIARMVLKAMADPRNGTDEDAWRPKVLRINIKDGPRPYTP